MGINIDESNRLVINPMGIDTSSFKVEEAKTEAPNPQGFEYVEPVEFGTGCFGNPNAFNRLQEILHQREVAEQNSSVSAEVNNSVAEAFMPQETIDSGIEPAFC